MLRSAANGDGSVAVNVVGAAGHNYLILTSTNMRDWTPLDTNASPFVIQDTNAPAFPMRFFRAVLAE